MDPLDIQIPYYIKKSAYNLPDNLFIQEKNESDHAVSSRNCPQNINCNKLVHSCTYWKVRDSFQSLTDCSTT